MKDPLEYTREELEYLSNEELLSIQKESNTQKSLKNTSQLVQKLQINKLYGAFANRYFPLFNEHIARAITGNGRYFIQLMARTIESGLQEMTSAQKPYIIYGDTDSVIGSTIVKTQNGNIKIEDLFSSLCGNIKKEKNNLVKHITENINCGSVSKNLEYQEKKINYIMKHLVEKRMFKIKSNKNEVVVTKDHSIIILRKSKMISVKPKEILKTDLIIKIKNNFISTHSNFEIEDLGVQKQWVYDIEVEDNHNFFGNNILVHNSNYFSVELFVERAFKDKPNATITDKVNFCDTFYKNIIDKMVQNSIKQFGLEYNAYNTNVIGSEREIIADSGVWTAKKKYFARVIDSEGVRYEKPKLKVMGLDIIKSGTPNFVKKKLKNSLNIILDSNIEDIIQWKNNVKIEFAKQNLNDIAKIQGVSNIDYKVGAKGIPIGARSVIVHNKYIKKLNLENEIQLIEAGTKVKQIYLKEPNIFGSNIIAWNNDKFIKYLEDANCVDYEICFSKYFLSPLELMTNALKWNITKETEKLDVW